MPPHPTQHYSEFLRGAEHLNKGHQRDAVTLTTTGNPIDDDSENGHSEDPHSAPDNER